MSAKKSNPNPNTPAYSKVWADAFELWIERWKSKPEEFVELTTETNSQSYGESCSRYFAKLTEEVRCPE